MYVSDWGGAGHELDLMAEHAKALRNALAVYVGVGCRIGSSARKPTRNDCRGSANGLSPTEIREWAKRQGIDAKRSRSGSRRVDI
jgi:hypothetical protein